jgi:uncharacterized protein (DUF1501 family)
MSTRRQFLERSALLSFAPAVPGFLARTARAASLTRDERVLVLLQLDGGNDGINTVVPFGDPEYPKLRKELRLAVDRLHKLSDHVGLHPSMKAAADLVHDGRLAIVQGVGYPNPDRSHFRSMAIWQTARFDEAGLKGHGWLGRALDQSSALAHGPGAVFIGERELPRALMGRRVETASYADASDLVLALPEAASAGLAPAGDDIASFVNRTVAGAYTTAAELAAAAGRNKDSGARYPGSELARHLELVARSIKAGSASRVYYVIQGGYDTHSLQLPAQAQLLGDLSRAVKAFLDDLAAAKLAERVLLLAFSEFGRRPAENGSLGTDHGTAGPVFVAGARVKPGLIGETPRLGELVDRDLKWSIDFRAVYATILEQWLELPSQTVLGQKFEPLAVLKT